MSDYKNIRGKKVKFLTSDLSSEQSEGQIFYSDTDNDFKSVIASAAWSSGGNLLLGTGLMAGAGTQTAALGFGGYIGPGTPNVVATTLEYNGNGWTSSGNLAAARSGMGGTGTQTAALGFGGATTIPRGPGEVANSEEYNGTSWTEGNNLNDALVGIGGLGTQTAAVGFGGGTPDTNATEHYDGTSWTNVPGTLTSARRYLQGCGTQTAGLTVGGDGTSSNHYDGSAWTAGGNLNTGRPNTGAVSGIQTSALMSGGGSGGTPVGGKTEEYNGTSWSEIADMAVGRYASAGANGGTTSASVAFGGYLGGTGYISSTEEFNRTVNTVTGAAWASGGNMNQDRYYMQGAGAAPQTAALGAGGYGPGSTSHALTEEYNGTSWSEVNNLPRGMGRLFGLGTQTAAIFCGGFAQPNTMYNETWEYDGTNWSEGGDMNTARGMGINFGTQTAGLIGGGGNFGGSSTVEAEVEEYNGTAWTEVNNIPNATRNNASFGTQTAGVVTQGKISPNGAWPGTNTNVSFEYDGTNWTAAAAGLITGPSGEGVGILTDGGTCGNTGGMYQRYDGTTWRTDARTASNGGSRGTSGTAAAAIAFAGFDDPNILNATEEFTAETTALNIKTLTDS